MKNTLITSFSCFYLFFAHDSLLAQERFITIDGAKIRINTIGIEDRKAGEPVLVFESGAGTPMGNWDKVLEGSSKLAPVVTYDRPGIGQSEAVDELPTLKSVADRLVKLLNELKLEPPYVLVGHSLGGVFVRGFAIHHPEKLAGLIIIDPGDFTETSENIRDYYEFLSWEESRVDSLIQSFVDKRKARRAKSPVSIQREGQLLENLRENDFLEISESPLPYIPVHILTGGRFDLPKKFWSTTYDEETLFRSKVQHRMNRWMEVIQSVERGMLLYSADAAHFVQWDDPELVIASIKIVLSDYASMVKKD